MPTHDIQYSDKYTDENYEYSTFELTFFQKWRDLSIFGRMHVILPPDLAKEVPKNHLMSETEWRNLGVQQSPGWIHYMIHSPEPHVLLFRRPRTDIEVNGNCQTVHISTELQIIS